MTNDTPLHRERAKMLDRRAFLARAGVVGLSAALLQLPGALRARGLLDGAASDTDLTLDTMRGLAAFVVPGPDPYSVAQGHPSPTPGGIAARAAEYLVVNLDAFVPAPALGPFSGDGTVPASGAVATMLNAMAAQVDPVATAGGFASHFSRLSWENKAEVFRRLEATQGDDDGAQTIWFVALALVSFAAYCCFSDWHRFDPVTRTLDGRPVGWDLTGYNPGLTSAADGWPELQGYYRGRRAADG